MIRLVDIILNKKAWVIINELLFFEHLDRILLTLDQDFIIPLAQMNQAKGSSGLQTPPVNGPGLILFLYWAGLSLEAWLVGPKV
jgi:hypothetical protein